MFTAVTFKVECSDAHHIDRLVPLIRRPLGIATKLFIAMIAVNTTLIVGMAVGARISFERGFLGYIEEEDFKRLDSSTAPLVKAYQEHGSWDFLINNHPVWHSLMRPSGHTPELFAERTPLLPPPLADLMGAYLRFSLLDANGAFVAGNTSYSAKTPRKPIIVSGHTVGWLLIVPIQRLTEAGDIRLQNAERDASWTLAVIATLLAIAIALWLARALGLPLQRIARATHVLANGNFKVQVPVNSAGELGQLEADFNHLARTLLRNEAMRASLVADVSHELRTPLAVMRGEVEALEVGIRPMSKDAMRSLSAELTRLSRLVDDLYHLSLSDVGALTYHWADIDVTETLEDVLRLVRSPLSQAAFVLSVKTPDEPCWVLGDDRRLQQVFLNIFQNVLRYVPPGTAVDVRISQTAAQVHIDIQDSGAGVPDESLDALFNRFYRVEGSRSRETGGAGLGLPICRSIIEAHHGTISARKSPADGLWVAIILPRSFVQEMEQV